MTHIRNVLLATVAFICLPLAARAQAISTQQPVQAQPQVQAAKPAQPQQIQPQQSQPQPQAQPREVLQPQQVQPQAILMPQAQTQMQAQDYADMNWGNLVRAMARFGALDLSDEAIVDDYALITECDIYDQFFKDDFKWNTVRQAVRKSVQMNIATYPVAFHYDTVIFLDRYDFNTKLFRFARKSIIDGVNLITIQVNRDVCSPHYPDVMPSVFHARLSSPIFIEGIPLSDTDAQALIGRMKDADGKRRLWVRYNLRVILIEPLMRMDAKTTRKKSLRYVQNEKMGDSEVNFNTRLDSIEVYENPERTKLLTVIKP